MARVAKFAELPTLQNQPNGRYFQYLYFLQIGEKEERLFKIGTTNNPRRRMTEHERGYKKSVKVLWLSPKLKGRFTSLKAEEDNKEKWINEKQWEYLRNDRFLIPKGVDEISITIKKEYKINICTN